MTKVTKVLSIAAAVLLLALAAALFWLWRSVPPLSGRERIPGLTDSVSVTFDSLAIPHIAARTDEDAFAALGYLHARERLWAMEVTRRAAEGRLSEMLGRATIETDRYLRSLDIGRAADSALGRMPEGSRRILDAYVRGVNAWIAAPTRGLPLEYRILRFRPEPWTARHTYMVARLMSWDLQSGSAELRFARAAAKVGLERVRELFPPESEEPTIVGPNDRGTDSRPHAASVPRSHGPTLLAESEIPRIPDLAERILDWASLSRASNSWVVAGSRTASGKPILANDPHLDLRAPSLWYLAAIASPGYHVAGVTVPGAPPVVIGHNARIAWGWTNGTIDDVDYVIERFSADTSRVLTADGWRPVEMVRDSIRVRGRPAVPFVLRRTAHGPIVAASPERPDTAARGEIRLLAMRWNAHDASDELSAVLALDRAQNWTDFLAAARQMKSPEQNWIYADVDGHIGYVLAGAVPVRRSGNGLLPTPGWTDEGRWERYLDFDELPRVLDPAEGFIVTANNRIAPASYPHFLARDWERPWRAQRIRELLTAHRAPLAARDIQQMQMDTVDVFARWAKDIAARAADSVGRADLAAALRAWDGTMGGDRTEPTLFWTWYRALQRLTFEDELEGVAAPGSVLQAMMRSGDGSWLDDVHTPQREGLDAMAVRAMRDAVPLADRKRWGDVHRTVMRHTLGSVAPLDLALRLTLGPRARAGSLYTVNVGDFSGWTPPFTNTHAASFRQVVDLATPDEALMILTSGQAGNPLSRHYRDQLPLWWRGDLARVTTAPGTGTMLQLAP